MCYDNADVCPAVLGSFTVDDFGLQSRLCPNGMYHVLSYSHASCCLLAGIMGLGMAKNLLNKRGHDLLVWNR